MPGQPLDTLPEDRPLRIDAVEGERPVRRRLFELGLLPGTAVTLVRKSALAGVVELEVRCCRFSLSLDQAKRIFASPR